MPFTGKKENRIMRIGLFQLLPGLQTITFRIYNRGINSFMGRL